MRILQCSVMGGTDPTQSNCSTELDSLIPRRSPGQKCSLGLHTLLQWDIPRQHPQYISNNRITKLVLGRNVGILPWFLWEEFCCKIVRY